MSGHGDNDARIRSLPPLLRRLAARTWRRSSQVLTAEQVIEGYRSILGRDPESEEVIRRHSVHGTLDALHRALLESEEYRLKSAPGPMDVGPDGLDAFVAAADALGGAADPRTLSWWAPFRYRRRVAVDDNLDPYSQAYVDQQLALYREISGRDVDQRANEMAAFRLADHVGAVNPYAHQSPSAVALHLSRLSRALQHANLAIGDHVLDMGSGWGLSSELFAYAGVKVTALDINPEFVELVRQRSLRTGLPITAVVGTFEQIPGADFYHAALYYECLHHAIRPWETLSAVRARLRPGGKLILAGETITTGSWRTWGLRLDPLSIYCIRKFGWFESGWSLNFLTECIGRCGFEIEHCADEGGTIGWIIVAVSRPQGATDPPAVTRP